MGASTTVPPRRRSPGVEWPTLGLIACTYLAFGLLTWFADALAWWIVLPLAGYVVCLHGSLQHEAAHGHPTRSALLNEALVFPSLNLWVPYRRYRRLHLAHHNDEYLTDPIDDPESWYLMPGAWERLPAALKRLLTVNNALLGRLVLGPAIALAWYGVHEARRLAAGDREVIGALALHAASVAVTLSWVMGVCGMGFWAYVLVFAYPGTALTLLRSFAEHRAHALAPGRTAVIETNPVMALLYLNNNLHSAHHERPRLPWYRLPGYYGARKRHYLSRDGSYHVVGYWALMRHYLLRPKERVAHPLKEDGRPAAQTSA